MTDRPVHKAFAVFGLLLGVTALHFLSATEGTAGHAWHVFFRKLYFVPILLGAFWFGFRGAVLTVTAVCVVYLFHIDFHWAHNPVERADQIGEIASFIVLGLVTGSLVRVEEHLRKRAETIRERARAEKIATTVSSLVESLGARDTDTLAHSRRVAALARDFGTWLELEQHERNDLYLAGLLHDVGKIGIRDDVLLKPGSLTADEERKIREHPHIAEKILAPIGFEHVIGIVAAHHENWDGSGYPHGLQGEAIPRLARVLAVVDTYDALRSSRPYKKGVSDDDVLPIMEAMAGKKLGPEELERFRTFLGDSRQAPVAYPRKASSAAGETPRAFTSATGG